MTGGDYEEVVLGGLPYRVGPLALKEWGEIQAWIKANVPGPVAVALQQLGAARAAGVTVDPGDRASLLREANVQARAWPPRVGTREWWGALDSRAADAAFLKVALARHQPTITAEQCAALAESIGDEALARVARVAFGMTAAADGAESPGPKAQGPPKATTPGA